MSPAKSGFGHPRRLRGDVNVVLNRLVAEGVIESFRTSFDDGGGPGNFQVTISCPNLMDADAVRQRVRATLAKLDESVVVNVATQ